MARSESTKTDDVYPCSATFMQTNGRFDFVNIDENKNRSWEIDKIIIRKEMKTKKRYCQFNQWLGRKETKRNET